jgi:hypothetical protein
MSALATAGAAAWVVPEILTAKPVAGATMSMPRTGPISSGSDGPTGSGVTTAAATTQSSGPTSGVTTAAATQPAGALASSGIDIQRDVEIGAALVAGGWAVQHWASRTPKSAADGRIEAGSAGEPS